MTVSIDETQIVTDSDDVHVPETEDIGSFNYSYLQMKLGSIFLAMPDYMALPELSLDTSAINDAFPEIGDFIVPDLAIYPAREVNLTKDILKMSEMPLLVIEILSPMQAPQLLVNKLEIYFALGVQSCWILYPTAQTVSVFTAPYQSRSFSAGEVEDTTLGIHLPIAQIFH